MQRGDGVQLKSNVTLELRGPDGRLKDERKIHNTVKTAGKDMAADRLLASPAMGVPTHMAVGTGTPGATALGTELDRNALTSKTRGTGADSSKLTMVGFWDAGDGTGTLSEAGVFDASSSGNMHLSASVTPAIVKGSGDTLTVTWTLTFA